LKVERAKRSLETHVTEVSFSCGPKIRKSDGRSLVYKSLKISPQKAAAMLSEWGYDPEKISSLSPSERVKQVFMDAYRPDAPLLGRIEQRAAMYLNIPYTDGLYEIYDYMYNASCRDLLECS
jgi:hypothetical protein